MYVAFTGNPFCEPIYFMYCRLYFNDQRSYVVIGNNLFWVIPPLCRELKIQISQKKKTGMIQNKLIETIMPHTRKSKEKINGRHSKGSRWDYNETNFQIKKKNPEQRKPFSP